MYTPHTVTVFNVDEDVDTFLPVVNAVIVRGVFLDISEGVNVQKSGLESANKATLYIPFSAKAVDAITGAEKKYLGAKEYEASEDKAAHWTLRKATGDSATPCFFAKGEVHEEMEYSEARNKLDYVYDVKTVDVRDFGSEDMRHWEVGGV